MHGTFEVPGANQVPGTALLKCSHLEAHGTVEVPGTMGVHGAALSVPLMLLYVLRSATLRGNWCLACNEVRCT